MFEIAVEDTFEAKKVKTRVERWMRRKLKLSKMHKNKIKISKAKPRLQNNSNLRIPFVGSWKKNS